MAFTTSTLTLQDGSHLYYTDSGPVPDSTTYKTVILIHGAAVNGSTFERLHPMAASHNLRTVALNRTEYPGSSKYTEAELEELRGGNPRFLERTAVRIAFFIAAYIQEAGVPEEGGVVVVGWSIGTVSAMAPFSFPEVLPLETYDLLNRYVKRLVLYDPPYLAFGLELPGDTALFDPWGDATTKSPEEVFETFKLWTHANGPSVRLWSVDSWTQEEHERFFSQDGAAMAEMHWFSDAMQKSINRMATSCLFDEAMNVSFLRVHHVKMPSSGLAVLVDNTDTNFTFNSPWSLSLPEPIWLNETYTAYDSFGEGNGTLSYAFEGTAIAFYGHADGQLQASIDGASPTYHPPGLQFQIYQPWFNIADLADTHHDIALDFSTNVYFDYAVISAGQSTPLQGCSILVDDSDAAMNYTGTWSVEADQMFATGDGLQQIPHGRSVHRSTKAGDYVLLQFTGSSISVYGIVQWQNPGRISTAYTLDGSASPQITTISSDGQRTPYTDQPNYLFFHADLAPGNHTLVVTLTEITDRQSFLLDYILYTAAFDSLAAMPQLTPGDIHPWTPPRVVRAKKAFPTGAIVGAAVGAVVLLALVVVLVYRTTRRRRPKSSGDRPEIDPLPEPVVRLSEPPSYTPTPTISLYQPSHTDVGASSLGGYAYPRGSSLAGTSSSTSHPPAAPATPTTPTALPPHSQHYPPQLRPFAHSPASPTAPTSPSASVLSSSPRDALERPDLVHARSRPPVSEKRSSKSEKHARDSVVVHQAHHPQGSRQSYPAPHVYAYGSGIHELQMSPTDINVYRA
ncbi:hypothetical protein EYR40_007331 [Pleurotus pulmonarius]|nr:hypothetical protein EYR40_007331 [Pleurotus pulmonarius]